MSYSFPTYRKYSNDKVFFKINSLEEFEEFTVGTNENVWQIIKTKIHLDRVRIQDMIENWGGYWLESSENEWNQVSQE